MESLLFWISLSGFLFVLSFGYRKYKLDQFRENLFHVRNNLFDLALANPEYLNFNSKPYRSLEIQVNNELRYAERLAFLPMLFSILRFKKQGFSFVQTPNHPEHSINSESVKQEYSKIMSHYERTWFDYSLKASFPMTVLTYLVGITIIVFHLTTRRVESSPQRAVEAAMVHRYGRLAFFGMA